jgi:hypothetical protein
VDLTSAVPARRFAGQPGRDVIWAVFYANAVAILVLWWAGSGHDGMKTVADALNQLGRVTALLGTYLVLWELVLLARVPWLDDAFGMERLVILHRRNGYVLLWMLIVHAVAQTIGYAMDNGYGLLQQLMDFIDHYDALVPAIASLLLLILVTGLSERTSVVRIVIGRDLAVATSGTYEKGQHIQDPHTGAAADELVSLTVVGPSILEADVQATAAFAMGAHAIAYLETLPSYEAYAIGPDLRATWTSGFDAWCA